MLRKILLWPDSKLLRVAECVTDVNDSVRRTLDDMVETMLNANGAGLAAPQIGVPLRLVTLKVVMRETGAEQIIKLVNPVLAKSSDERIPNIEGCLSFPGVFAAVQRARDVVVHALDEKGVAIEVGGDGFLAIQLQHELEHLDGKVLTDHINSTIRRDQIRNQLQRLKKRGWSYPDKSKEARA